MDNLSTNTRASWHGLGIAAVVFLVAPFASGAGAQVHSEQREPDRARPGGRIPLFTADRRPDPLGSARNSGAPAAKTSPQAPPRQTVPFLRACDRAQASDHACYQASEMLRP